MRKILFLIGAVAALVTGCKKNNDRAFEETPEERVIAQMEAFEKQLTESVYGWKAVVVSSEGQPYGFWFQFNNQNRVTMVGDFNTETATTPKESSYRVKALQQVTLMFDTYSYIHLLADPDPASAGGELGAGYGVDFEFYFDPATSSSDSIRLVGRKRNSTAWLVRASANEGAAYASGALGESLLFANFAMLPNYFKRITVDGVVYDVRVEGKTITISWVNDQGEMETFSSGFYYTTEGIVFSEPLEGPSGTITGFSDIQWDGTNRTLGFTTTGTVTQNTTVSGTGRPLIPDPQAWTKFRQIAVNAQSYWITVPGFTVNGVQNAHGLATLTSGGMPHYYTLYWPGYNAGYDLLAPIFLNQSTNSVELHYGAAASRTATLAADGRAQMRSLGTLSSPQFPFPASGPFFETARLFFGTGGFYFVQTGNESFDMVSAADGTAWISWELF